MNLPIARQFADFAAARATVPSDVTHAANRAILDTLGAMIAGGAHQTTLAARRAVARGPGAATLATGGTAEPTAAALVNGTAAHAWDIDDTSYTGIMHGSAVILPAILAVAEDVGADTATMQHAFVAGSEIAYTLADLCTHDHYFRGWWSTVTFGLIGATAAVSVVLGLTPDQASAAISLAAAGAGGGKSVFGTDAKPVLAGEAARRAIDFAYLARAGITAPATAFEDDRGFLALLNARKADLTALQTLGQTWRLVAPGLLFKTNPVCSAAHAAIDQMQALMTTLGAEADDIASIRADVPDLVYISLVYPDPATPQEAQFSLPYALACVALNGRVRFEDLTLGAIQCPEKVALMRLVTTHKARDLSTEAMRARYPESARLKVTLKDGRSAEGFTGSALGMPDNPQSDAALLTKFETACAYAGRSGPIEAKLGDNPAATLARLIRRASPQQRRLS